MKIRTEPLSALEVRRRARTLWPNNPRMQRQWLRAYLRSSRLGLLSIEGRGPRLFNPTQVAA